MTLTKEELNTLRELVRKSDYKTLLSLRKLVDKEELKRIKEQDKDLSMSVKSILVFLERRYGERIPEKKVKKIFDGLFPEKTKEDFDKALLKLKRSGDVYEPEKWFFGLV